MELQQKTTLQQNIEKIEKANRTTLLAVSAAVSALNNSYKSFWDLPDAELLELLQYLFDNGKMQEVFAKHYNSAASLNAILDAGDSVGNRAIAKAAKEIAVENDQVFFVQLDQAGDLAVPDFEVFTPHEDGSVTYTAPLPEPAVVDDNTIEIDSQL
jgi:hypothetical protein